MASQAKEISLLDFLACSWNPPFSMLKGSMDHEGGELGLFQFLKHNKTTLTYAMLVRHQFTNRITKLPTQAIRDKTRRKV